MEVEPGDRALGAVEDLEDVAVAEEPLPALPVEVRGPGQVAERAPRAGAERPVGDRRVRALDVILGVRPDRALVFGSRQAVEDEGLALLGQDPAQERELGGEVGVGLGVGRGREGSGRLPVACGSGGGLGDALADELGRGLGPAAAGDERREAEDHRAPAEAPHAVLPGTASLAPGPGERGARVTVAARGRGDPCPARVVTVPREGGAYGSRTVARTSRQSSW